jgi:hypothetical protein
MRKHGNIKEFAPYMKSLRFLEQSFQAAGIWVEFGLVQYPNGMKVVELIDALNRSYCTKSIEGDSVGQAIKDIADAVKL